MLRMLVPKGSKTRFYHTSFCKVLKLLKNTKKLPYLLSLGLKVEPFARRDDKVPLKRINPILERGSAVLLLLLLLHHAQGTPPPWILKRDGLESSGRRLITSIGKTKRIENFFGKIFLFFKIFWFLKKKKRDFLRFFQIFQILDFLTIFDNFLIFRVFLFLFLIFIFFL